MMYETDRLKLIQTAEHLKACLAGGNDEDAFQHALVLLNGLHGVVLGRWVRARERAREIAAGCLEEHQ